MSSSQPEEQSELEWIRAPLPGLLRLGWPIVISMLSHSLMTLVDTLFVSRLGPSALAGVGLGGIVSFSLICFPMGLLGAVKILGSQAVGAGRSERVVAYLGAGVFLAVLMSGFAMVAAFAIGPHLASVTASPETAVAAESYLAIVILGAAPLLVRVAVDQARLSRGDSQWPMRVTLFANVCNMVLDYWLIIVLGWGVEGAAYATLAANILGCLAILGIQALDSLNFRETHWYHVTGVWRIGLPSGFQFAMELGSFTCMVVMLTNLSDLDGAANQIAIQVIHFGFLPCVALGDAASIMAGQAVGAGRRDLVHVVARYALIPTVAYTGLAMLVFGFGGDLILSAFTSDPELARLGAELLLIAAFFQIADGINIVARSVLRGTGDVTFCAWMGIFLAWMLTPPLTWLLGYHMGLGAVGGWLGLCLDVFVGATIFWLRLHRGRWHRAADATLAEVGRDDGTGGA